MASKPIYHGIEFTEDTTPIKAEMKLIEIGGYWTNPEGKKRGLGLFQHYRNLFSMLWPEDDHHRWSDQILRLLLDERITVVMGSRDSSKTRTVSKWALCDYYCFPNETLTLMTSTNLRGLELRVFGDIKSLHERAKERFEWLPGNVTDAKHGIFTDDISERGEIRDMRKGIIGVPCIGSQGEYLGDALKDFCFPAGAPINTPVGPKPIELVIPGDVVLSATGYRHVSKTFKRLARRLVRINFQDGRSIVCTPNHEFLTQLGWQKACNLNETHYILGPYESLRELRKNQPRTKSPALGNAGIEPCPHRRE